MDEQNKPITPAADPNTPVVPTPATDEPVVPAEPVAEVPGEVSDETPAGEEKPVEAPAPAV
ncbi:MAG: hypothetical protein Q7R43_00980 [Candidatus Daviesbacteria bacterium]|nr:hypothetical protein [Candidatus Daviesbacteria bacterium]